MRVERRTGVAAVEMHAHDTLGEHGSCRHRAVGRTWQAERARASAAARTDQVASGGRLARVDVTNHLRDAEAAQTRGGWARNSVVRSAACRTGSTLWRRLTTKLMCFLSLLQSIGVGEVELAGSVKQAQLLRGETSTGASWRVGTAYGSRLTLRSRREGQTVCGNEAGAMSTARGV